jgi:hypothetical protein
MFNLSEVAPATLTAVGDSLTMNDPALPTEQVTAASHTHLYVAQVAKGLAQGKGLDIRNPDLYKSEVWYQCLTGAVAQYAPWVEIVGDTTVATNNSTHTGSIDLSGIMGAVMSIYLGPEGQTMWTALSSVLGSASDPATTDFMNFWWSHVAKSTTSTGLSIGPNIQTADGQIQWAVVFYTMTHVIDDWRTMFISSTYEEFDVTAGGLTLNMDYDTYIQPVGGNPSASSQVDARLGALIGTAITTAPFPTSSAALTGQLSARGSLANLIASAPLAL